MHFATHSRNKRNASFTKANTNSSSNCIIDLLATLTIIETQLFAMAFNWRKCEKMVIYLTTITNHRLVKVFNNI